MGVPAGALTWACFACSLVVAYLLCGIPTAYLVGKHLGQIDVRTVGSGNIGSTNVTRAAGVKCGVITLLGDIAKAALSMGFGYLMLAVAANEAIGDLLPSGRLDWMLAAVYLMCIVGHVFSVYMGFKGGKGIAVGFGGAIVLAPFAGLLLVVPFLICAVATRYVSLGSIVAAICLPVFTWLLYAPTIGFQAFVVAVTLLVLFAHRSNILKLIKGEERKFSAGRLRSSVESQDNDGGGHS